MPFYVALPSPRIDFTVKRRRRRNPDRAARRRRSRDHDRTHGGRADRNRARSCRTNRRWRIMAFDVTPGAACQRADHRTRRDCGKPGRARVNAFPTRAGHAPGSGGRRMSAYLAKDQRRCLPMAGSPKPRSRSARGTMRLLLSHGFCCVSELPLAVRPPRRSRRARRRRRNLDRRDQVVDRGFPRRPEMAGLPAALRPAVLCHDAAKCRARFFRRIPA